MDAITTTAKPVAPFDFDLTAGYHTYFRGRYGTDSLVGGIYRRLLDLGDKLALVSVRSTGSISEPELAIEVQGEDLTPQEVNAASRQVMWVLGGEQDLAHFYAKAESDPILLNIINNFYGLHLPHTATVFEALVLAILGQQIATAVARIIRTLLIETYGLSQTFDDIHYAFPRPESLHTATLADLRQLKLSQRKAEYVKGIAAEAMESTDEAGPAGWRVWEVWTMRKSSAGLLKFAAWDTGPPNGFWCGRWAAPTLFPPVIWRYSGPSPTCTATAKNSAQGRSSNFPSDGPPSAPTPPPTCLPR